MAFVAVDTRTRAQSRQHTAVRTAQLAHYCYNTIINGAMHLSGPSKWSTELLSRRKCICALEQAAQPFCVNVNQRKLTVSIIVDIVY
jgi:hypothetical protein